MAEFEKTLVPSRENTGSDTARQTLRELVSTRFYKEGTRAANWEAAVTRSKETQEIIEQACTVIGAKLPPSDDVDLSAQPIAAIEPIAPALDAAYARILATEPPVWACNPADGYSISVPNFLGIRMFSQLTAADAMRQSMP